MAGTSVKLVISSEVRLVDLIHTASEKMAELAGFDADEALNVGLAVREAVINAIVHGNKENPELTVDVELTAKPTGIEARVQDQGGGFDPDATPDPTEGNNLLATTGRGLLLMRAFVDDVVFRPTDDGKGTEVMMTKRNGNGTGTSKEKKEKEDQDDNDEN